MMHRIWKYKYTIVIVCSLISLVVYLLMTFHTRKIKSVVRNVQISIRNNDVDGVMHSLDSDYLDDYGYRKNDIQQFFESAFEKMEDIRVIILDMDILRNGDSASVKASFRVVATVEMGFRGYVLGNVNQPAEVTVYFVRSGGRWRIIRAGIIDRY